jgi:uncharacterized protein
VTDPESDVAHRLSFIVPSARLAVCRLAPSDPIPAWGTGPGLWSISRSEAELSVVCEMSQVPEGVLHGGPWRALLVMGPLGHELVGVLATIASTLAAAQVPIFAISTHDTDWILVPEERLAAACAALLDAGHQVES